MAPPAISPQGVGTGHWGRWKNSCAPPFPYFAPDTSIQIYPFLLVLLLISSSKLDYQLGRIAKSTTTIILEADTTTQVEPLGEETTAPADSLTLTLSQRHPVKQHTDS